MPDGLGSDQRLCPGVLAAFPDVIVATDLSQVHGFEEPVVLMAGAASETTDQVENIFVVNSFGLKFVDELFFGDTATEQTSKGAFESFDAFLAEIGLAQADFVYAADFARVSAGHDRKRRDVSRNGGDSADIAIASKSDKGMRADYTREAGVGLQVGVAAQIGSVDDQTIVAYVTVVRYVSVNHKQAIVTDLGQITEFFRAAVYGNTFAKSIVVSDTHLAEPVSISKVLRRSSDDSIGKELIVDTYDHISTDGYAVVQNTSWTNANLWPYNAERSDDNIVGQLSSGVNAG